VGSARESIHVESFKALTVIESKLDATRKKLARRLLEEQDKLSKAHFAQKGGEEGEGQGLSSDSSRACRLQWPMWPRSG
jgi:hypothetical protein